jgi:hypothetical protein
MTIKKIPFLSLLLVVSLISSCRPSYWDTKEEEREQKERSDEEREEKKERKDITWNAGEVAAIMSVASKEQNNRMYSPSVDTTYLYWLNNYKLVIKNQSKCNIFALNTLYKAGFRTPLNNCLTRDMMDSSRFSEIFPVVAVSDPEAAKKGDLIVWNGHVIIFEALEQIKNDMYAVAWWAGTTKPDNGDNIKNNVSYGKYKLKGYYLVRRPIKK